MKVKDLIIALVQQEQEVEAYITIPDRMGLHKVSIESVYRVNSVEEDYSLIVTKRVD